MSYISYQDFTALGGSSSVDNTAFSRLEPDAERIVDLYTTGVDNIRKLALYFPTDPASATIVKRCLVKLITALFQAEQIEAAAFTAALSAGGSVASMSSGSESVSFGSGASEIAAVAADSAKRDAYFRNLVTRELRGIQDANGVNLLYGGFYPLRVR